MKSERNFSLNSLPLMQLCSLHVVLVSMCGAECCRPGLIIFMFKSFSDQLQISDNLKDKKKSMVAIIIKIRYAS